MGYLRGRTKNYLYRHPHLLTFYRRANPLIGTTQLRDGHKLHRRKILKKISLRTITSRWRGLPDFVIIGARKSGTTSLYDFVIKHPAIAPASKKEVVYFSSVHYPDELRYRSNFPTNLSRRRFYKKTNQKLLSGEATPFYLFKPMVPGRMKDLLPDVKLIVILRNPVDRAYSDYHFSVKREREALSFESAIKLEEERCAEERERMFKDPGFLPINYYAYSYLAQGLYADQLERWFKHYVRKQFLILATEDLYKNRQLALDQVFDFLGVSPFQVGNLRDLNVGGYKEMNADTRKFLIKYFKPHNERLSKLLQRSFDWDR